MGGRRRRNAVITDQRVDTGVKASNVVDEVDTSMDHLYRKSQKSTLKEEWGMGYRSNICLKNDDDNGVRWLRRFDDNSSSYSLDNYYHRYNYFRQRKERRSLKIIHRALTTIGPLSFTCIFFVSVLFLSSIVKADRLSGCQLDNCAQTFTRDFQTDKVMFSSNIANCVLLTNYAECLSRTSRLCRGNLRFHSLRTMVNKSNRDFNCSAVIAEHKAANNGEIKTKFVDSQQQSTNTTTTSTKVDDSGGGRCLFPYHHQKGASGYRYCSAFGDPHIRTFDGQHETCKTLGAWPLLDNAYLNVQLMNKALIDGLDASGITQISVIVKALPGCTDQKTYTATTDSLPSAFDDGTIHSGEPSISNGDTYRYQYESSSSSSSSSAKNGVAGGERQRIPPAVFVQTLRDDEQIEIHLRYVATRVIVRKTGDYLSVAVKMPEDALSQESTFSNWQLCLAGCPSSEKINYKEILAYPDYYLTKFGGVNVANKPATSRDAAITVCRNANLTDFFFDSCVFDLLVTGDVSFRDAARSALDDIRHMYPPYVRHYETNRSDLRLYDDLARLGRERESSDRQRYHRQYNYSATTSTSGDECRRLCFAKIAICLIIFKLLT